MSGFKFGGFAEALAETAGKGVSFEGMAKKWESEAEGKCYIFSKFQLKLIAHIFSPRRS